MIKTIIMDDEPLAREVIIDLIAACCKDIEVIAQGADIESGLQLIKSHRPDLLFLDIQLMDGTGFDLLRQLGPIDFKVIFITAFEEYAIQAFRFSALDYLLKPINPEEFGKAIVKARSLMEKESVETKLNALFANLENIHPNNRKIVLRTSNNYHLLNLSEIIRCQSDKNYTHFFTVHNDKIIVSKTLKEYEELLQDFNFVRIHQSHLVNLEHIRRYDKSSGGQIVMSDNTFLPVSFRKKDELMRLFERIKV